MKIQLEKCPVTLLLGIRQGHLVREIDAFDGVMPKVADASGIQFRLLNHSEVLPLEAQEHNQIENFINIIYLKHSKSRLI